MKKIILALVLLLTTAVTTQAQTWNMVITHNDGKVEVISTQDVKDVTFTKGVNNLNTDLLVIKELYNAGVPTNNEDKVFAEDKGFIIYNNSSQPVVATDLAVGIAAPYNAQGGAEWLQDGQLKYLNEDYIPAANGIWYFPQTLTIPPYSQIVVSCMGSIDNTKTYEMSVNYANPDYYCMYDPNSQYVNKYYYPAPSDVIPTSHYLKAVAFGMANAWPLSTTSPAFFIFQAKDVSLQEYFTNPDNFIYPSARDQHPAFRCVRLPREWVIDAIEVFTTANAEGDQNKRLTADLDAGKVFLTPGLGHTLYRNVDKEATESLPENTGKLVYNYSLGVTDGDPNGIDAEASIKNGAHIIYMDNNNSTEDFHERSRFSIRDN